MSRVKAGQSVAWVSRKSGRVYTGTVKRTASETHVQVLSRDGFMWLLPVAELDLTNDWRHVS